MANDEKAATSARLAGLAIILALGIFYIFIGHDWYFNGKMALCTYDETVKPASWCYNPPDNPKDRLQSNTGVNGVVQSSLDSINDTYRGKNKYFNDDIVGNLFNQIGDLIQKWFSQFMYSWFWPVFAPQWNAFFVSEGHRLAFGVIVGGFYAALVSKVVGSLVDWSHGK